MVGLLRNPTVASIPSIALGFTLRNSIYELMQGLGNLSFFLLYTAGSLMLP